MLSFLATLHSWNSLFLLKRLQMLFFQKVSQNLSCFWSWFSSPDQRLSLTYLIYIACLSCSGCFYVPIWFRRPTFKNLRHLLFQLQQLFLSRIVFISAMFISFNRNYWYTWRSSLLELDTRSALHFQKNMENKFIRILCSDYFSESFDTHIKLSLCNSRIMWRIWTNYNLFTFSLIVHWLDIQARSKLWWIIMLITQPRRFSLRFILAKITAWVLLH